MELRRVKKKIRIWAAVAAVVLVLLTAVNVLTSVVFYDAVSTVLGHTTTVLVSGGEDSRFVKDYATKAEAVANGNETSVMLCREGSVLLKNQNAALPMTNERRVTVFGKNSVALAYGGSGSGGGVTAEIDLMDSLAAAGFEVNPTLTAFYRDDARSGPGRSDNPSDLDSGSVVTLDEGETPLASYSDAEWTSCADYSDAAIIVITRIAGEGFDMPREESGAHSLQLSENERQLIDRVAGMDFGRVIVLINTATTMELKELKEDERIGAVLWIGFPGGVGVTAVGELLRGETNAGEKISPSGRTVDTWAADFTHSPVWPNFGAALGGDAYKLATVDARTGRSKLLDETVYFTDYEEGIYVGYRYWETADAEAQAGNYPGFVYEDEVVFPFGYGLSYTTFEWEMENALEGFAWEKDGSLTLNVRVTNTGDYPGKDVVELYVTPPWYGKKNADGTVSGIEKAAKTLVGFAKTKELALGENQTVSLTVDSPYLFASYDCYDANGNGFTGYEAEKGEYLLSVSRDAHTPVLTVSTVLNEDLRWEETENRFTGDVDRELKEFLSRADFTGTWPQTRTDEEKIVESEWAEAIKSTDTPANRPKMADTLPVTGAENGVMFPEMAGLSYDDPKWDTFMDQLTVEEMTGLINNGAFHTQAITRLQVPQTTSSDGPAGFTNFMGAPEIYDTCVYPCEVVVASAWNETAAYQMGLSVGNEALAGNEKGDGAPYSGWYAPGLNLHRSPFCGRNFEYYSEDSFLSGRMTASIVEGCGEKGVFVTMKHFALNEQETHRAIHGVLTWATEQSIRELYLKPFELAIHAVQEQSEADGRVTPMAVMSSFNRIGDTWTGGDWRLLTGVLREEWGFEGLVISDFNTCSHMIERNMFYAGGDLDLQILGVQWSPDPDSPTDMTVTRQAAKNILYVVANSNAVRGEFRIQRPLWQRLLWIGSGAILVLLALRIIWLLIQKRRMAA
ncbi:MAG: glycoside hydrolase family 3 C-terminal domain-containing protein [Clostridia bacterium]|nr:glycoside hydrolase family 3 C-terminal domain-containing protein [Clostridia bacterium]